MLDLVSTLRMSETWKTLLNCVGCRVAQVANLSVGDMVVGELRRSGES